MPNCPLSQSKDHGKRYRAGFLTVCRAYGAQMYVYTCTQRLRAGLA